jgi:hypothetical protein
MRLLEDILDVDQGAPRALQALEDPSPADLNRYPGVCCVMKGSRSA